MNRPANLANRLATTPLELRGVPCPGLLAQHSLRMWKDVPSWFLVAGQDRNIPAALQHFFAGAPRRAGRSSSPPPRTPWPSRTPTRPRA